MAEGPSSGQGCAARQGSNARKRRFLRRMQTPRIPTKIAEGLVGMPPLTGILALKGSFELTIPTWSLQFRTFFDSLRYQQDAAHSSCNLNRTVIFHWLYLKGTSISHVTLSHWLATLQIIKYFIVMDSINIQVLIVIPVGNVYVFKINEAAQVGDVVGKV